MKSTAPTSSAAVAFVPDPARPAPRELTIPAESPDDAVQRILKLPATDRLNAATQLLLSLADEPELASRVAQDFSRQDAAFIREHGTVLVSALTTNGDFTSALLFAEQGGPERPLWLGHALTAWAGQQPELAAEAALAEFDGEGFPEIAAIWAGRDPAALAGFALDLPPGAPRSIALKHARQAIEADVTLADRNHLLAVFGRIPD